jgi:hypothetical protein
MAASQVKLDKKEPELREALPTNATALNKPAKEDKLHEAFEGIVAVMLTIATFAAGVTFNLLLKPSNPSPPTRAFIFLAYANALFCAALIGCALVHVSIELVRYSFDEAQKLKGKCAHKSDEIVNWIWENDDAARFILGVETSVVGAILFVAVYLLLYSSSLFLQVRGPLILGSVLYGILGVIACIVAGTTMFVRHRLDVVCEQKLGWIAALLKKLGLWRGNTGNKVEERSADDGENGFKQGKKIEEGGGSMK